MDYRTTLAIEVRDLAKRCGIKIKAVAGRLGLDSVRNFNYWCKGQKFPSHEHVALLVQVRQELAEIDQGMNRFGGRKAYLEKMR